MLKWLPHLSQRALPQHRKQPLPRSPLQPSLKPPLETLAGEGEAGTPRQPHLKLHRLSQQLTLAQALRQKLLPRLKLLLQSKLPPRLRLPSQSR